MVDMGMMLRIPGVDDDDCCVKPSQSSPRIEHGCNQCGTRPTYLTPAGLRCREHMHQLEDWDDWIPLARKVSRQRTARPAGGSAGSG